MSGIELLAALLVGHSICDYAWQGDFMATAKNFTTPVGAKVWPWALWSHSMIHGGAVWLVTGSSLLGLCEAVSHGSIDYLKCANVITYDEDQALHVLFKAIWCAVLVNSWHGILP